MNAKAKESAAIQKARTKLQKRIDAEDKKFTQDAIAKTRLTIGRYLQRHKPERIDLKSKQFALFDENRHPAKTKSAFISHLLSSLQHPEKQKISPMKKRTIHHL